MICIKCKRDIPEGSVFCMYCGKQQTTKKKRRVRRANGNGGAWKRGSTYTAVWTAEKSEVLDDGRIRQFRATKGGFATRREAEDYAMQMSHNKERPKTAPALKTYWVTYRDKVLPGITNNRQTAYKRAWDRLKPLHNKSVDGIMTADMQKCIDADGITHYAAKDMKTLLGKLFEYAASEGWCNKDMPYMIHLPQHKTNTREPFTVDEVKTIWESYKNGNQDAGIPLMMIYTGMMPGELMKLRPNDIDFVSSTISPRIGLKTETRRNSPIVLNEEAIQILKSRVSSMNGKNRLLFSSYKNFYDAYYKALEKAGVRRLEPYSCRHTTATILSLKQSIPAEAVKKVMRWASVDMLDTYAHPDIEDAMKAVATIRMDVDNSVDNKQE